MDPPKTSYEDHELGWSIGLIADALGTDANWTNSWDDDVSLVQEQCAQDQVSYGPLAHAVHAMRLDREKLAANLAHAGKTQG